MAGARFRRFRLGDRECGEVAFRVSASTKPSMPSGCASGYEREFYDMRPLPGSGVQAINILEVGEIDEV